HKHVQRCRVARAQVAVENTPENFGVRHVCENLVPILLAEKVSSSFISQRQKTEHRNIVPRGGRHCASCMRFRRTLPTERRFVAPLFGYERFKILGGYTETGTHLAHYFSTHEWITHARSSLGKASGHLHLGSQRAEIRAGCLALDPIIEKITRA